MIYRIDFIRNKNVENRSELVAITLLPESDLEDSIFTENEKSNKKQVIEHHYWTAIKRELPNYNLLSILENYGHSKSAVASVKAVL